MDGSRCWWQTNPVRINLKQLIEYIGVDGYMGFVLVLHQFYRKTTMLLRTPQRILADGFTARCTNDRIYLREIGDYLADISEFLLMQCKRQKDQLEIQ